MVRGARFRMLGACIVALYSVYYLATITEWHFIDAVDLLIHEAGHVLFTPLGQWVTVFMGSGFQILIPLVFAWYFFRNYDRFAGGTMLVWASFSTLNVSLYASDAVRMQLPLLGGEHDWNWILSDLGLLRYTDNIATTIYIAGVLIMVYGLYIALSESGLLNFLQGKQKPTSK